MNGVSIVICCHNSSERLPATLHHVIEQKVDFSIPWEIIVVDNASTDNTVEVAKSILAKSQIVPFRVVHEPQLGLSYARDRGLECATYEFVSLVDDDNWVNPNWVQTMFTVMTEHLEVAACGGQIDAVFDEPPPTWFSKFQGSYAVGKQAEASGDVTWTRGYLWGAGLIIRKEAWNQLRQNGYRALLTDRKGKSLTAGGDSELCFAFRLAGWRLWYDERLKLKHFMPSTRLQWSYLRSLQRGFGASTIGHDPYHFALKGDPTKRRGRFGRIWASQAHATFRALLKYRLRVISERLIPTQEGTEESLKIEWLIGRLIKLLQFRDVYDQCILEIWRAPWKRVSSKPALTDNQKPSISCAVQH